MSLKTKAKDPYRLNAVKQLGWSSRGVSLACNVTVLTYITFYCTNILGMNAALVGTLLLASKLFDGFTDLVAGALIDRTRTKLGKARPYEFSIIGVWVITILLFSCPDFGEFGKAAWVFVMYSCVNSIFATLLNSSEAVYLVRAFKYDDDRSKVISINGFLITLFCTVISIIFPIMMDTMGTTREGWTEMFILTGVPLGIIGLGRLLFVKEININAKADIQVLGFKEMLPALKNKYVWLLCGITILNNLIATSSSSVGLYYFEYIVGDIGLLSVVGAMGLIGPFVLLFMPKLLKKISVTQLFFYAFLLGIAGSVFKGIAGANMVLVIIGNLLATIATLAPSYFTLMLITYIMDYHEWKTGTRVEGVLASINSFSSKVAQGLASGGVGLIMGLAGFDGTAEVISSASKNSIIALYGWIPVVLYIVMIILLRFFNLEKKLPTIRSELEARHNQNQ